MMMMFLMMTTMFDDDRDDHYHLGDHLGQMEEAVELTHRVKHRRDVCFSQVPNIIIALSLLLSGLSSSLVLQAGCMGWDWITGWSDIKSSSKC